ncbi:hypothetical protein BX666DRAFT_2032728 [Dichotomocladium elegans]|nr:hypothetical protein BX666DRAFT_2032728 [Dichotomocladium elegans]
MSAYPSVPMPPTPQGTPRNSSSSPPPGPRFSVNSNLMNYSIPKNNHEQEERKKFSMKDDPSSPHQQPMPVSITGPSSTKREIQRGNSSTQVRQLEAQIESLTLQNVKLQRTNRLLKVDTDNLIKQKTQPLDQKIHDLTLANVQLQRATRLLQQDLQEKAAALENFKRDQILQMKSVGPEYEFLVQMVNVLHRQISGNPTCDETCCYTSQPINQSTMVMTLPPENEQQEEMEAQHICRPVIHSSISQGSYAIELENKIVRLEQLIEELDAEKEQMLRQQAYKDNDIETLKRELRIKDDIVSQLETDFLNLEEQLARLQRELNEQQQQKQRERESSVPIPTYQNQLQQEEHDTKRQSQLLMDTKRRSLAIKDTDALERMLRGDLQVDHLQQHPCQPSPPEDGSEVDDDDDDNEEEEEKIDEDDDATMPTTTTLHRSCNESSQSNQPVEDTAVATALAPPKKQAQVPRRRVLSFLSCGVLPCAYPAYPTVGTVGTKDEQDDPFALFTFMTIFLGLASQMGITDDWTLPITLTVLVSGFLWSGAAKGVQFKLKLT